mgnify:CR=1 FL=1
MLSGGTGFRQGQGQKEDEGQRRYAGGHAPVEPCANAERARGRSRAGRHPAGVDAVGVDPALGQGQVDRGQVGQRAGGDDR